MFFWIIQILLACAAGFFFLAVQGYSTMGLCCLGLMAMLLFYRTAFRFRKKFPRLGKAVILMVTAILILGLLVFAATESVLIHAARGNAEEPADYVLVLGAKVNARGPSLALRCRIDAAYDYLTTHPDCIAILSGGQGSDEPVTEAQCMYDGLVARGIDPDRLWLEDQSTNTWENMKFSQTLLEEKTGSIPEKIALVSSEFHLYRAQLFARRFGFDTVGVPAATTLPVLKVNYFIREAVAVWYYLIFGGKIYG